LRKAVVLLVLLLCLVVKTEASDILQEQAALYGADDLADALSPEVKKTLEEYDPISETALLDGLGTVFRDTISRGFETIEQALQVMTRLIGILILSQMIELTENEKVKSAVSAGAVLAITVCCGGDMKTMIGLGKKTMQEITSFSAMLMPVMTTAVSASGGSNGAAMAYAIVTFFSNLLMKTGEAVIIPLVYAYLALGMADGVIRQERLKSFRELIGWMVKWLLKGIVYLFTGLLGVTGSVSANVDAAALKAIKMTVSGVVPVVGGMISNAAETIVSGAELLKGYIGTYGMLAILALFLTPFLKMGVSYLVLRLTAALSGILESKQSGYLGTICDAMGYLLALVASSTWISLLACVNCMKAIRL